MMLKLFTLFTDDPWADPYNDTTTNILGIHAKTPLIHLYHIFRIFCTLGFMFPT
jgi:hypothetical protein